MRALTTHLDYIRAVLRFALGIILVSLCAQARVCGFTLLTYNVAGNGSTDWSTNAPQVRAIARQMMYLRPDIITFNEVPFTNSWQMTNFVTAFLPGYFLARNSGTDGFLRSVILSRFPIKRSDKWLDGVSVAEFGAEARFARDLFEAEIQLPGWEKPLHVFTTHLKSQADAESAQRRGAEAFAVSNFFKTIFLPAFADRPYVLTGDLNEDVERPPSSSHQPVQRLANSSTGLRLTRPVNPVTGSPRTISIRGSLTARFDYILPCGVLFSNIVRSDVFRTDLLNPLPDGLEKLDDKTASDHLPVWMEFAEPSETPLTILSASMRDGFVRFAWTGVRGRQYEVHATDNFSTWVSLASGLVSGGSAIQWEAKVDGPIRFFRLRESLSP